MHELKKGKEAFTMVEGPFKGRKFEPGKSYDAIPPGMAGSFTEIKKAIAPGEGGHDRNPAGLRIVYPEKAAAPVREVAKAVTADDSKQAVSIPPAEKGRSKS